MNFIPRGAASIISVLYVHVLGLLRFGSFYCGGFEACHNEQSPWTPRHVLTSPYRLILKHIVVAGSAIFSSSTATFSSCMAVVDVGVELSLVLVMVSVLPVFCCAFVSLLLFLKLFGHF